MHNFDRGLIAVYYNRNLLNRSTIAYFDRGAKTFRVSRMYNQWDQNSLMEYRTGSYTLPLYPPEFLAAN